MAEIKYKIIELMKKIDEKMDKIKHKDESKYKKSHDKIMGILNEMIDLEWEKKSRNK